MNAIEEYDEELSRAYADMKECPTCQGFPVIKGEPGCYYTQCILRNKACPQLHTIDNGSPLSALVKEMNACQQAPPETKENV